jgi:hypothetical protein
MLLVCLLASVQLSADDAASCRVYWEATTRITWNDFGASATSSTAGSGISTGIEWNCGYALRQAPGCSAYTLSIPAETIISVAWMNPEKSWMNPSQVTVNSLEYLRLQFDIQHAYAQRLAIELQAVEAQLADPSTVSGVIRQFAQPILDAARQASSQCGQQTLLGSNAAALSKWMADARYWIDTPQLVPLSW